MTEYGRIHTDRSRSGGQPVLLPCPFCGGEVTIEDRGDGDLFVILCPEGSPCTGSGLATFGMRSKKDETIAAWNTRQPTQSDALREALRRMPEPYEYLNKDQLKSIRSYVDALRNWNQRYRAALQEQSK